MPFIYSLTVAGSAGQKSTLRYELTAADYATAVTDAAAILAAFQAVSDAVVQRGSLADVTEYPATLPTTGVDTAILATLSGKIVSTQKPVVVRFPAPKDAVRLGTSGEEYNELDLSNAAVEAYWDLFGVSGESYISDGENVAASPRSSQIVSRASRNP